MIGKNALWEFERKKKYCEIFILHLYRITKYQKYIKEYFLFNIGKILMNVLIVN